MKVDYQGIGANRHALVYNEDGIWVATIRADYLAQVVEALVPGANRGAEIQSKTEE